MYSIRTDEHWGFYRYSNQHMTVIVSIHLGSPLLVWTPCLKMVAGGKMANEMEKMGANDTING